MNQLSARAIGAWLEREARQHGRVDLWSALTATAAATDTRSPSERAA